MRLKSFCFVFFLFSTSIVSAQTSSSLDSAMRLVKSGKLEPSLPIFERILTNATEPVNQKTINTLSEYFADHKDQFDDKKACAMMGNMLIKYTNPILGKQNKTVDDIYTIGIANWAVISTGTLRRDLVEIKHELVLQALNGATQGGNTKASAYMAKALRSYKRYNPAVPYGDVLAWANQASIDKKSPRPLLDMVDEYDGLLSYGDKQTKDTVKQIIFSGLNAIAGSQPDSFYAATDFMCQLVLFATYGRNNELDKVLKEYYNSAPVPPSIALKKGIAWYYLYTYLYDHTEESYSPQKQAEVRNAAWKRINQLYENDKQQLLSLLGEFSASTSGDIMSDAMGLNWLQQFSPQPVANPKLFYKGAAATGQNFAAFLEKEAQPQLYVDAILSGYEKRQAKYLNVIKEELTTYKGYLGDTLRASIFTNLYNDRVVLKRLMQLPAFANNTKAKYINANANFLFHHAFANYKVAVNSEIDELPALVTNWSAAEKKAYPLTYYNAMLSSVDFASTFTKVLESTPLKVTTYDPFTLKPTTTTIQPRDMGGKKLKQTLDRLQAIFQ